MIHKPPLLPLLGMRTRVVSEEEKLGLANVHFAAFLSAVHAKTSPERFEEHTPDRPARGGDHRFTEQELEAFFQSLDEVLMPAALASDAGLRRVWARFWSARSRCCAAFVRRFAEETHKVYGRRLDAERDRAELDTLERSLMRALLRQDRRSLHGFVGRRGVDPIDLTFALWTSHAAGWFELATARSVIAAMRTLSGVSVGDGVEHGRPPHDYASTERRAVRAPRPGAPGAIRPYQALGRGRPSGDRDD